MTPISTLLRRLLDLRRQWRLSTSTANEHEFAFNDGDLILLFLLSHVYASDSITVVDNHLCDKLSAVCQLQHVDDPLPRIVNHVEEQERSLVLIPISRINDEMTLDSVNTPNHLVCVYGWRHTWSPPKWRDEQYTSHKFIAVAGVSPSLWASSIQLLLANNDVPSAHSLIERARTMLNDRDMDVWRLLDRIQDLELKMRKKTDATIQMLTPIEPEDMTSLRQQIDELTRINLEQQVMLAEAITALAQSPSVDN